MRATAIASCDPTITRSLKPRYGAEVQEARRLANPDGYHFISRQVLPRLKELGASDPDMHQITVQKPRQFFAGS